MNATSFQWNAHDFQEEDELRPEFWGDRRVSPVTGKVEVSMNIASYSCVHACVSMPR